MSNNLLDMFLPLNFPKNKSIFERCNAILGAVMKLIVQIFYLLFYLLFNLGTAAADVEGLVGDVAFQQNLNLVFAAPTTHEPEIIISRKQYVISYNKNRRAPNWVAWLLDSEQIGGSGRANRFTRDSELEKYLSGESPAAKAVTPDDYTDSCFDRGHLAPSADRSDNPTDNETTFVMSNIVPQTPYLNRVLWKHLEQYTRKLVQHSGKKAYIIAGPIYDMDYGMIGPKKDIPVPSKNFKIIFILDANQSAQDINQNTPVISAIMPNILGNGKTPFANRAELCKAFFPGKEDTADWKKYQTTLAEVEKISGVNIHFKQSP